MEHEYHSYGIEDRVRIKSTNEYGDAFESAMGYISVFIDGEDGCRYFDIDDVEFQ